MKKYSSEKHLEQVEKQIEREAKGIVYENLQKAVHALVELHDDASKSYHKGGDSLDDKRGYNVRCLIYLDLIQKIKKIEGKFDPNEIIEEPEVRIVRVVK